MACDRCWRLKARCIFDPTQDDDCAQCRKQNAECTWTRTKKPTPAPDKDYVLYLEDRTKEIELRLKRVLPGINIKREIDNLLEIGHDIEVDHSNDATTSQTSTSRTRDNLTLPTGHSPRLLNTPFTSRVLQTIRLTDVTSAPSKTHSDEADRTWSSGLQDLLPQYYGPSSVEGLAENAKLFLSRNVGESAHFRPQFWRAPKVESRVYANDDPHILANLQVDIPEGDFLRALVDGYFERVNFIFPILHRQLFESQLSENLHARDGDFARLLLVVCALGSRWCEDPRVLDDQWPLKLSAGYRWFRSAYRGGVNAVYRPSLVNAQFMVLSFIFLLGSSSHDAAWLFAAKASRIFETLGAHREKQSSTLADELLKRSFRCYFILDRFVSTAVGKPSVFQNIDMDVDDVMVLEDHSWIPESGALRILPPSHGGSLQLVALNHASKLCTIIGQALQTVFAPGSVKMRIGLSSSQGEEWMIRSLNQQLNRWAVSIPVDLRLPDPEQFSEHSIPHLYLMITLWTGYCYAAIYINRPFITSKVPEIAAASFHNCRQAARQCAQMVHAYYQIPAALPLQCAIPGVFSSAMILIIDLIVNSRLEHLGGSTVPGNSDYSAAANERDLKRCSDALGRLESYLHISGRLNDVMKEFQAFWSSRLADQSTTATGSTQSATELNTLDSCMNNSVPPESLGRAGVYAEPPPSISTFAWQQSASDEPNPEPTPGFSSFFEMGIPNLLFSPTQLPGPVSDPIGARGEPHSFPYDAGLLSGDWMLNVDDLMAPGSATYGLTSLPPELGRDWDNTMEGALRLNESATGL